MINYNEVCISTYYAAKQVCEEIFKVACKELYAPELNHLYTRDCREKYLDICRDCASASFVKKVYDYHLHDHYKVEIPSEAIDDLMSRAIYEKGYLKIGDIEYKLI